jgi:hypothetical protein
MESIFMLHSLSAMLAIPDHIAGLHGSISIICCRAVALVAPLVALSIDLIAKVIAAAPGHDPGK